MGNRLESFHPAFPDAKPLKAGGFSNEFSLIEYKSLTGSFIRRARRAAGSGEIGFSSAAAVKPGAEEQRT